MSRTTPIPHAAPSPRAFAALLLIACLFGANHVAARLALDNGTDVVTAVAARSLVTAVVVGLIVKALRVPVALTPVHRRAMPLIGLLVAFQSLCLYSAVARIPVGLALLAFNTYPLFAALAVWLLQGARPQGRVLVAMPLILAGLALALGVAGTGSGGPSLFARLGPAAGPGVALAVAAAAAFGLVLAITQQRVADLDGRLRTTITMAIVGTLALGAALAQGGLHWPQAPAGWWGLGALTVLYGTAFTAVFMLLPRLGVVGNSPILNVEPVAAMGMAWLVLGQTVTALQGVGAALVVATVMWLGLARPRAARS